MFLLFRVLGLRGGKISGAIQGFGRSEVAIASDDWGRRYEKADWIGRVEKYLMNSGGLEREEGERKREVFDFQPGMGMGIGGSRNRWVGILGRFARGWAGEEELAHVRMWLLGLGFGKAMHASILAVRFTGRGHNEQIQKGNHPVRLYPPQVSNNF
ncbi:hypothetical protein ACLOJK_006988 [Asimina triloba]